jgi:hypothetical protein
MAQSDTNMIDGAKPIMEVLRPLCGEARIVAGEIKSGIGARCFAVKLRPTGNASKVTVVTRSEKQDFHIHGGPAAEKIADRLWKNETIRRRYIIKTAD